MKRILFLCVNYCSYEFLSQYLSSIDELINDSRFSLHVGVADNSDKSIEMIKDDYKNLSLNVFKYDNVGYLGAASLMWKEYYKQQEWDFVIISNVDMLVEKCFLIKLLGIDTTNVGWIVPDIMSKRYNVHRNPYILQRPSKMKMNLLRILYSSTFIYNGYKFLKNSFKKNISAEQFSKSTMYAGHGSFMMFTSSFIKQINDFEYPPYMYGEEIYFAELMMQNNLLVKYYKELKVNEIGEGANTYRGNSWMCKHSKKAINYLYNVYFK